MRHAFLLLAAFASITGIAQAATKGVIRAAATLPVISSFTTSPATINAGDSATLSWTVAGANNIYVSSNAGGDVGTVTGKTSVGIKPAVTTTYIMSAYSDAGVVNQSVTITVIQPKPPAIGSFSASPTSIVAGSSSTLSWAVTGATSVSISPGVGVVTGNSVTVSPTANTTYTLKATNGSGGVTKTAAVKIAVAPVISSFTATPATVVSGDLVKLAWSVTGASSLSVSPAPGTVTGSSVTVNPTANTTYVLTATSAAGSVTKSVDVTATPPAPVPPVISSFKASPASIVVGGSTTLSWSISGAKSVSINQGVGAVTGTKVTVSPTSTTSYLVTASNDFGTSTQSVNVTVKPAPPVIGSFGVAPNFINPGDTATLSWAVSGADSVTLTPASGAVTGTTLAVKPSATTTYTLSATNAGGTVTQSVLLAVASNGTPVAHPRIWLTPASVTDLSQRATNGDPAWIRLRDQCDTLATFSVSYPDGPTYNDGTINGEYEYSGYIDPAITLGLCYQVAKTADSSRAALYGAKVRALVLALSDPTHHGTPTLDSGFGIRFYVPALAIAYDWSYELLSPYERAQAYTEINRWIASFEKSGFNRDFPQGNYFAGYYFAKAAGTLATEGDNPQAAAMWDDWLNRVHYGMVQPYYEQWLAGGGTPDGWNYGPLETLNMTRPLLAVLTAKGVNLLSDANKPMSFPDGHARWMTQFTWPDRKTVNDRGMLYTNNPNRPPSNVDATWATEYNGLLRAMGGNNAPIMQQFTSDVRGFSSNESNWAEFLYWNQNAPKADYTTALSYRTRGDGQAAMRSDWGTGAVWGAFQSGPFTAFSENGEEFPDQGSLVIQRGNIQFLVNAFGALTTPTPGTQDATDDMWQAIHSDVLDQINGVEKPRNNFNTYHSKTPVGAMYAGAPSGYWGEFSNGPGDTNTTLSRFEDGGQYVLMRGAALEGMFFTGVNPVTGWNRDVVYVRPQLFVVYDRTSVDHTNTDDWMAWHVMSAPTEQAGTPGTHQFEVVDTRAAYGGNLYRGRVTTVLPAGHKVDIVDIVDQKGVALHKVYRLEVRPGSPAAKSTWLTVFDASASANAAASVAPITAAAGNVLSGDVEGALIAGAGGSGNTVVLFSKAGTVLADTVSISVPVAGTYFLVTDLLPNTGYSVISAIVNGNTVLTITQGSGFITTAEGTLSVNLGSTGLAAASRK